MTEDLKKLLEAATPLPWYQVYDPAVFTSMISCDGEEGAIAFGVKPFNAALIVAAVNALPELLAKVEWQPIETAPRDGTQILACQQLSEHLTAQGHLPDLSIVKWDDRKQEFVAMADGYMSIKSQGDNWTTYHEPYVTHWQPLPTLPATKDTQDE